MYSEMTALIDCYSALQESKDPRLIGLVGLAIRRCARIMTGCTKSTQTTKENELHKALKTIYDNEGKIPAIREYRIVYPGSDLLTAKKEIERMFPYVSPYNSRLD